MPTNHTRNEQEKTGSTSRGTTMCTSNATNRPSVKRPSVKNPQRSRISIKKPALPRIALPQSPALTSAAKTASSFLSRRGMPLLLGLLAAVMLLSALGVAGYHSFLPKSIQTLGLTGEEAAAADTITVSLNGRNYSIPVQSTLAQAIERTGVSTQPGRLLAVDGSVIDETGGSAFTAQVNNEEATGETVLAAGDTVFLSPGQDSTEPTEERREVAPASIVSDDTIGSVHQVVSNGAESERIIEVGTISNIEVVKNEPEATGEATLTYFSVRPTEKVVALTFDDGPWGDTTAQLLDLLKEHDAHATFFVVGTCFDGDETESALLKREFDEGHQVCTHTYSHASAAQGFRMANLSAEAQIQEIKQGQEAIAAVTGQEASKVVRMPGGAYDVNVAYNVAPYVTYEIGWDIDTQDWRRPGPAAIEEALAKAEPGDIVLMHDGGGDRSQTIEALRNAIPRMKEEGWSFVTIDELLAIEDAERDYAAEAKPSVEIPQPQEQPTSDTTTDYTAQTPAYGYGYDTTGTYGYTGADVYSYNAYTNQNQTWSWDTNNYGYSDWGSLEYTTPSTGY